MNKRTIESEQALRAMQRAANNARERAATHNLMVPVWQDGRIIHVDPKASAKKGMNDDEK